jgi:hypothetical protein
MVCSGVYWFRVSMETGGCQRKAPLGGAAYFMPRYELTLYLNVNNLSSNVAEK